MTDCPRTCECRGLGQVVTNDPRPGDVDTCPALEAREEDDARRARRDGYQDPPNANQARPLARTERSDG